MWGRHLILDCSSCERAAVRDAEAIRKFCDDLVSSIGMVAYGEPVLEHFATHLPEAAGYSLVQLIETSAVTGHFCDESGDAYLDVFSCKDFDPEIAIRVVQRHLRPVLIRRTDLYRDAPRATPEETAAYGGASVPVAYAATTEGRRAAPQRGGADLLALLRSEKAS
jgi:S-adenosylmethionine/arginine decarboxylase-like enzyme